MRKEELHEQLDKVEKIANFSKLQRFIANPFRYLNAIGYREIIYPIKKKEKIILTDLFYRQKINVALPASTDIYLTKGKSHSSEIRLARFLIDTLAEGDLFIDIGAHIGYFSLLASKLVGHSGKILSFEPAPKTFHLLELNTRQVENVSVYPHAVSNTSDDLVFYELPNYYSEYNTSDISQFEKEDWFKNIEVNKVAVKCTTMDNIVRAESKIPKLIKIDVEGGEFQVLSGALHTLTHYSPIVVMEYLSSHRSNQSHIKATELLLSLNYTPYIIHAQGMLVHTEDIEHYLRVSNSESENVVFLKMGTIHP